MSEMTPEIPEGEVAPTGEEQQPTEVIEQPQAEGGEKPAERVYTQAELDKILRKVRRNASYQGRKEAEAELYRQQAERANGARQPEPVAKTDEPKRESFETYEDYLEAKAEWKAERKVEEKLREAEQKRSGDTQRESQARQQREWSKRLQDAQERYDDWDSIVDSDAPMTDAMSRAIVDSEKGPDIVYWLAKNPQEAKRIAALSEPAQAREIGKIEDKVAQPAKKPSNAPPPITPVGSRSTGGDPLSEKLPMSEWAKNFEKQFYARR